MRVNVTGRHVGLSDDQKDRAEAEAQKLGKYFNGVMHVDVTFSREHNDIKAEIIAHVAGHKTLVATERAATVNEALEFAGHDMARQIKKHKDKLHRHRPRVSAGTVPPAAAAAEAAAQAAADAESESEADEEA
jgi:ribosomal subunit interface protein